jgi:hypothetical protein
LQSEWVHAAGVLFADFFSHCVHILTVSFYLRYGFVVQIVNEIELGQAGSNVRRLPFHYRPSIVYSLFYISHYLQTQNAVCLIKCSVQRTHEDRVVFFEINFNKFGQDEFFFEFFYVILEDFPPVHSRHYLWMPFLFQNLSLHQNTFKLEIFVTHQNKIRAFCLLLLLKNKHVKLFVIQKLCVYLDVTACEFSLLLFNKHQ